MKRVLVYRGHPSWETDVLKFRKTQRQKSDGKVKKVVRCNTHNGWIGSWEGDHFVSTCVTLVTLLRQRI